jgi:hypothetical protein
MADSATSFNLASPFLTWDAVALIATLRVTNGQVNPPTNVPAPSQSQIRLRLDPALLARTKARGSMLIEEARSANLRELYSESEAEDRVLAAEGLDEYFARLGRDDAAG